MTHTAEYYARVDADLDAHMQRGGTPREFANMTNIGYDAVMARLNKLGYRSVHLSIEERKRLETWRLIKRNAK